jgi:ABC-type amino acid transport substrate-binding protein
MLICVVRSTTFESTVRSLLPDANVVTSDDTENFYKNFINRDAYSCNVLAGDLFETANATLRAAGLEGDYEVVPEVFSKEPLSIVTRQDDSPWSDFVNWIVLALLRAETSSSFPPPFVFGEQYSNMFKDAIKEVGNYGDLYAKHLEDIVPRSAVNKLVNESNPSGLLYAMPFGDLTPIGSDPAINSTLSKIRERGYLECGVSKRAIFALHNATTDIWSGFDVDFCRALSAAIFEGSANMVKFTDLSASERFRALNEGTVDVLSRITTITMPRDVFEQSAGSGFTFSQPNFYDGVRFGGIPPYVPSLTYVRFVYWLLRAQLTMFRFVPSDTQIVPYIGAILIVRTLKFAYKTERPRTSELWNSFCQSPSSSSNLVKNRHSV